MCKAAISDEVMYEIYVQSFSDSDGDGIGDIAGIIDRLDYLKWLGVTIIWLTPCFESKFRDAGYDVVDYYSIASRYGTADDLHALIEAARVRGIRVLLDLVPGHTSNMHPWFRASEAREKAFVDRYVWSPVPVPKFLHSSVRGEYYLPNFFPHQPALNFGYARSDPEEPWRLPVDANGPLENRREIERIAEHWLEFGVSGFRVDMAPSLVKDDPGWVETSKLWRQFRASLDSRFPEAILVAEWGVPKASRRAGFDSDFFLHVNGNALRSLWDNGYGARWDGFPALKAYFDARGEGTTEHFLREWLETPSGASGSAILPTANHDFPRLACGPRQGDQLKVAMTFVLTWPSIPAIYFGDEIGMRQISGLPDKEGSLVSLTCNRAGSRTPMQWDASENAGFSMAPAERLYLPIDPDCNRPTVAAQRDDPNSLLNLVKTLIALRRETLALGSPGSVDVLNEGYPLCYRRQYLDRDFLVVLNPLDHEVAVHLSGCEDVTVSARVVGTGVSYERGSIISAPFGYAIFQLKQPFAGADRPRPYSEAAAE